VQSRSPMTRLPPAPTLGYTSETGFGCPGHRHSPHDLSLCFDSSPDATRPTEVERCGFFPTPPEFSRPSGDVIAEVRSSRDYHPRHLPPLVFLKPSTACSLSNSPVLFHTGTTYGIQRTRTMMLFPLYSRRNI